MAIPTANRPKGRSIKNLRMVWGFALRYPGHIAIAALALLVAAGATVSIPWGFRLIIDKGFGPGAGNSHDLAPWFEQAQPKMAAAAKALKDGNFTDPALANLGSDPFPAMPDGPRMRLQALAAKTRECDGLDAFAPAGSNGSFGDAGQPPRR